MVDLETPWSSTKKQDKIEKIILDTYKDSSISWIGRIVSSTYSQVSSGLV